MIAAHLSASTGAKQESSKSLSAAMFFGSLYFLLSSICPEQANFTGSFAWVDPVASAVLGVACALYGRKGKSA